MIEMERDENLQEQEYLTEEERVFTVKDDKSAEWCLGRIGDAKTEKEYWKRHYEEQLAKINAACDFKIAYMEHKLSEYFRTVPHRKAKTQESYALPGGKLVLKRQDPEFDTSDPAFLKWLKDNKKTEYIKVTESPEWGAFKKTLLKDPDGNFETTAEMLDEQTTVRRVITEDGEIVPGIVAKLRPPKFVVEVK